MKLFILIGVAAAAVVLAVAPSVVGTLASTALHSAAPSVVPKAPNTNTLIEQAQASRLTMIEVLATLCLLTLCIIGTALVLMVQFQTRILAKLKAAETETAKKAPSTPTPLLNNLTVETSPNVYFTYHRTAADPAATQATENAPTTATA